MRKITAVAKYALLNNEELKMDNTTVSNGAMFLFGNRIAKIEDGVLWITNCGYTTRTTKERLNALPGVSIQQKAGVWYLNGAEWDGRWIAIK